MVPVKRVLQVLFRRQHAPPGAPPGAPLGLVPGLTGSRQKKMWEHVPLGVSVLQAIAAVETVATRTDLPTAALHARRIVAGAKHVALATPKKIPSA